MGATQISWKVENFKSISYEIYVRLKRGKKCKMIDFVILSPLTCLLLHHMMIKWLLLRLVNSLWQNLMWDWLQCSVPLKLACIKHSTYLSHLAHLIQIFSIQLIGLSKSLVTLTWKVDNCSSVEISGLDIGWGQVIIFLMKSSCMSFFILKSEQTLMVFFPKKNKINNNK